MFVFFSSSFYLTYLQWTEASDDGVEVVKAVVPEDQDKRDDNTDQVALETVEQEHYQHPPPQLSQGKLLYLIVNVRKIIFHFICNAFPFV